CVQPASLLTPRDLAWLWPGRLALGKLAMLDGDPGLGKSLLALDLCARLSTGRPFPDGTPGPGPAASIFLNGEDGDGDTPVPRLLSLGADLERAPVRRCRDAALLRLPGHLDRLDAALRQTRALVVVLDPVVSFLDAGVQIGSDPSVRQALAPLADL